MVLLLVYRYMTLYNSDCGYQFDRAPENFLSRQAHRALVPACAPRGHGGAQVRDPGARGTEERHVRHPGGDRLPRPARLEPLVPRGGWR